MRKGRRLRIRRLGDAGAPANGNYDLRFHLFDMDAGASLPLGGVTNENVTVSNGLFTVTLDFGAAPFDGGLRWLEIGVRTNGRASAGVFLPTNGTSWAAISDRNVKKNFAPVDGREVLQKLASLAVQEWNYQWEPDDAVPHIGPMAQDFKAAFFPGRDDKSITTQEADGVGLAAIQGLNQKVESENAKLREENAQLKVRLQKLERLMEKLALR